MDPGPAEYTICINGQLGPATLSAFPAMHSREHGTHTVLTGRLDQSALYGVLAAAEALGLELLEVHKLAPDPEGPVSSADQVHDHNPG
ncbi:MAG TPA: hypothetical protein VH008_24615 [Pseudonocardia sp.]|jgi:hypothetical protein|nr:hypothetical protein [Pseudonocardia sp.]